MDSHLDIRLEKKMQRLVIGLVLFVGVIGILWLGPVPIALIAVMVFVLLVVDLSKFTTFRFPQNGMWTIEKTVGYQWRRALLTMAFFGLGAVVALSFWRPGALYVLLVTVVAADTFALVSGVLSNRYAQKARLTSWLAVHPSKISPNKTVGGYIGGLISGTVFGYLAWLIFLGSDSAAIWLVPLIVAFASQVGDWIESRAKRASGVKDFASYLGSHGSISSRLDSVTAGAIAMFVIVFCAEYMFNFQV